MSKPRLIRITTEPHTFDHLLSGQLHFMSSWFKTVAVASDAEYLRKIGDKEQVEVFTLGLVKQCSVLKDLIALCKLYTYLKKDDTLIVHTHTAKAGFIGMLAAFLAGVPHRLHTVDRIQSSSLKGYKRRLSELADRITYGCSTGIFATSIGLKNTITNLQLCRLDKIKVIGNGSANGIDTAYFNADLYSYEDRVTLKTSLGIGLRDFVFIYVGPLISEKGINELISAFNQVLILNDSVKLLLVGSMEHDSLDSQTIEMMLTDSNIINVSYQKDARQYFSIADALVFPSYNEGFPEVVIQAGAMGMPAIVTDISGCNEIIEDGNNGLIVPVKDRDKLAKAMLQLLEDQQLNLKLQDNARDMITSRFEQIKIWKALLAEYKSINGWQ